MASPKWLTPEVRSLWAEWQRRIGETDDGVPGIKTVLASLAALPAPEALSPAAGNLDARSANTFKTLDAKVVERMRKLALYGQELGAKYGFQVKAIQSRRTCEEQNALLASGRGVTKAGCGQSWHNYGVAVDFGVFDGGRYVDDPKTSTAAERQTVARIYKEMASRAKEIGLAWGGDWVSIKDYPHFQPAELPASPTAAHRKKFEQTGSVL